MKTKDESGVQRLDIHLKLKKWNMIMIRLAALLFVVVGPFMAGMFVLVATAVPQLGLYNLGAMGWIVLAGFIVDLPLSYILAKMLPADLMGGRQS